MDQSGTITVEEEQVDIRQWRSMLEDDELGAMVAQMDQDLNQAKAMLQYGSNASIGQKRLTHRTKRLVAMRTIHDDDD